MDDLQDDHDFFDLIQPAFENSGIPERPPERRKERSGPKRGKRYLRRSKEDHDDDSIGVQNERTGEYLDGLGAVCSVPDDIHIDREVSGTTIRERPGLIALLGEIEAGNVDYVCVLNISRLTRSYRDAAWLEEFFGHHGTECHVVGQGKVTGFALLLGGYEAQVDRERFLERAIDGRKEAARRGDLLGKIKTFGYDQLPDRSDWTINEAQADIIRRIARDLDSGMTENAVVTALNREGVPSPGGAPWSAGSFYQRWGPMRKTMLKGVFSLRIGGETVERAAPHLMILDPQLFDRLYAKFVSDRDPSRKVDTSGRFITGGLRCSCGAPLLLYRPAPSSPLRCQAASLGRSSCASRWQPPAAGMVRSVLQILRDEILAPERAPEWAELLRRDWTIRNAAQEPRRNEIRAEVAAIDLDLARETSAVVDDLTAGSAAFRRWRELQKVNLSAEFQKLAPPEPGPLFAPDEVTGLKAACSSMMMGLPDLTFGKVEAGVLKRLHDILSAIVVTTDAQGERYELRLLLGPRPKNKRVALPDASSPRWLVRSFPRPDDGALRFPEVVLEHHRRAERGEFEMRDEVWVPIRRLFASEYRLGLDARLVAEAVVFMKVTNLSADLLPERYFDVSAQARIVKHRVWPKVVRILRECGSEHARELLDRCDASPRPTGRARSVL